MTDYLALAKHVPEPGPVQAPASPLAAESDSGEFAWASRVLSGAGVRLMEFDGAFTIGIWSDLDSPTLRTAIRMFHPDGMPPIRYLDAPGIPARFKLRSVPGDPVPLAVLEAMQANPEPPWKVRDRMLSGARTAPWATWKAQQINRVFAEQGTGGAGWITPAAVMDGFGKFRIPTKKTK